MRDLQTWSGGASVPILELWSNTSDCAHCRMVDVSHFACVSPQWVVVSLRMLVCLCQRAQTLHSACDVVFTCVARWVWSSRVSSIVSVSCVIPSLVRCSSLSASCNAWLQFVSHPPSPRKLVLHRHSCSGNITHRFALLLVVGWCQ